MRWLLTALFVLLPTYASCSIEAGSIGKFSGSGVIERGKQVIDGGEDVSVEMMDTAVTAKGRMQIDFKDDTRVDLTEHARLTIDEFVYDPSEGTGSLSLKATLGGVRYASGQIAKNSRQRVRINTPSATISVRGTDFVMVVDEMGGSMVTLLPSCDEDGFCFVGEIKVETDVGFVIMNQAFETTITTTAWQPPSPSLIIDADEQLLNQLLIIRKKKPYDEALEEEEEIKKRGDFLGLDWLQVDFLDSSEFLDNDGFWVTTLDKTDWYLGELLFDMLDRLNEALRALFEDELMRQNAILMREDTNVYGFDPETGITLQKRDPSWIWEREDEIGNNYIRLVMNQEYGYNLNVRQSDFTLYGYKLGVSTNNEINITQCNDGCTYDNLFK